jgi:hypothetical protein
MSISGAMGSSRFSRHSRFVSLAALIHMLCACSSSSSPMSQEDAGSDAGQDATSGSTDAMPGGNDATMMMQDGGSPVDTGTTMDAMAHDSGDPHAPMGAVDLPSSGQPVTLVDLRYAYDLHKMIAPGAGTGNVVIVDPDSLAQTIIPGFGSADSADEGQGVVFAIDRGRKMLMVGDPSTKTIVAQTSVAQSPDFVRYIAATKEVWVTESASMKIEVFSVPQTGTPMPTSVATIAVMNDVQGLAIDNMHHKAYVQHATAASMNRVSQIDIDMRMEVAGFYAGCITYGNAIVDEQRNLLFAACGSARVVVMDLANNGAQLSNMPLFGGGLTPSIIAYNPSLSHVYLRGDPGMENDFFGVGANGVLSMIDMVVSQSEGSCMAADDRNFLWVCDTVHARLLRFHDTHPATPH